MFLFAAAILSQSCASAQICPAALLTTYLESNFVCTIGNLSFSNFAYASNAQGTTAITAAEILVSGLGPLGSGASAVAPFISGAIGLSFDSSLWTTNVPNSSSDAMISFTVSVLNGAGASIAGADLVQDSFTVGAGTVTIAEGGCGPVPCSATQWDVSTSDSAFVGTTAFTPVSSIQVNATISLALGASGTAGLSSAAVVFSQIQFGVDLSAAPSSASDWNSITTAYPSQFVIARAWGGALTSSLCPTTPCIKAKEIFLHLPASPPLQKAAYTFLNYMAALPGPQQLTGIQQIVEKALPSIGTTLQGELAFLAVDVENDYLTGNIQQQAKTIYEAVQAIQKSGLKAVIYTRQQRRKGAGLHDWAEVTGGTSGTKNFSCLPLWDALPDDEASISSTLKNLPYGGWTSRAGKQYATEQNGCASTAPPTCTPISVPVDLDVFDPSYLLPTATWGMADDVTSEIKEIPTSLYVKFTQPDLTLTSVSQQWEQTITISNPTDTAIPGPVLFVLDYLTGSGFTLQNPSGTTSCTYPNGSVYVNVSSTGIAPQQPLPPITLYFTGPSSGSSVPSPYTPRVLSGSGTP